MVSMQVVQKEESHFPHLFISVFVKYIVFVYYVGQTQ